MESNWRYNVWALGMWGSYWRLAARRFFNGFPSNTFIVNTLTPSVYDTYTVVPGQLPVYAGTFFGVGNFPYGLEVEPDNPN